jgi:enterochelin esterase-like enzyme
MAALVAAGVVGAQGTRAVAPSAFHPAGFERIVRGPSGGSIWQGVIRDAGVPALRRDTLVYLPPGLDPLRAYPVVVLLQGFRGSPYSFSGSLRLASVADAAIASGRVRPFLAVVPPAGVSTRYEGEWAGLWETYLLRDVLGWARANLPASPDRSGWTLAGLSAGGYGAVDIGLRHPLLFGTLESWSGTFSPPHDGPLRHASGAVLAAHDPSRLVQLEAARLRRLGTRFFLSAGTHDRDAYRATLAFARELAELRLPYRLWIGPGGHDGRFWRSQLPDALSYAVGAA